MLEKIWIPVKTIIFRYISTTQILEESLQRGILMANVHASYMQIQRKERKQKKQKKEKKEKKEREKGGIKTNKETKLLTRKTVAKIIKTKKT